MLDCNRAMIDRYGYTLDELRTMTPYQLHPPDELEIVERNIDDRDDRAPHCYTHLTKEGKSFPVEPLPKSRQAIIDAGGLIPYTRTRVLEVAGKA